MTARRADSRALVAGAVSAAVVTGAWTALSHRSDLGDRWGRRNFRDREVTLLLGPAIGAGALAGVVSSGQRGRRAALAVVATAAAVGAYDDLYGDQHARGLRGHARALREGRLTTGMVKLVSLIAVAALSSAGHHRQPVDAVLGTVLIAGGANLTNLFDLRPGRAAKVSLATAGVLSQVTSGQGRAVAAVAAGAAVAALPADLREQAMLGDCGAGTLGTLLGWSAAAGGSRRRRGLLAAVVIGLTLASERVSFSAVIERQPVLHALDQLGRQPA